MKKKRYSARVDKSETVQVYKTNAALGKARTKVAKALPTDPVRAKEVLESQLELVKQQLGPDADELSGLSNSVGDCRGLSQQTVNTVRDFYYRQVN